MKRAALACILALIAASPCAAGSFSASGRLTLRGVVALDSESVDEDPSLTARVELDGQKAEWRLHAWIEGGWDGTVRSPHRDHSLLKSFDEVYQDNTPYAEFKELYVERPLGRIDLRMGIQRFAWGRLDEYPVNDLFNPWDYTQFILRPIEERKIGVPALSASTGTTDWTAQAVWVPWLVPYRLPKFNERWSVVPAGTAFNIEVTPREPDLPPRSLENGAFGLRVQRMGDIEWAVNLFHGFDPRPVFQTTALHAAPSGEELVVDPGVVPSFHRITSLGMDAAAVVGPWSLRAEAAYTFNRAFNVRQELWGFPELIPPGTTPLHSVEVERDTLDYGVAGDYRPFEDALLTLQAQQTVILDRPATLFEQTVETILWANLKVGWMNRKIETSLNLAYNPEHGATMARASAYYIFTDSWKAGLLTALLDGPPQSLFGRYAHNDQIEAAVVFSW